MSRQRALLVLIICVCAVGATLRYPDAPRGNVVDDYSGVRVADPYRWLENPDSPQTRKWIQAENALTDAYLATVPNTQELKNRLTRLWSPVTYPGDDNFLARNRRYFFLRRDPGKNQPVLYWTDSTRIAPAKVLLDPNTLKADGTAALEFWSVSRDGKLLAYGIARSGSDWEDIHFRSVETCKDLADSLEWAKFSRPEWSAGSDGVYYQRFPKPAEKDLLTAPNYNQQLRFHKIGTPQSADRLIYERPDHRDWAFNPTVTEDGRYLIIVVNEGTRPETLVFYKELDRPARQVVELNKSFEAQYLFLGNEGPKFYLQTTNKAPRGRIISMDTSAANRTAEIVPEKTSVLDQAVIRGQSLYLDYEQDVVAHLYIGPLHGQTFREIKLPGKGAANWASQGPIGGPAFLWYESFTEPSTLYSVPPGGSQPMPFEQPNAQVEAGRFETRQIFYPSKDGTKVPMFLVGRQGFRASADTPCLLWGYGGFDISVTPHYGPLFLEWIERGGIVAVANLRGGSEYGESWHQAGMKLKKQNVFDDFISAAEWLSKNGYTSRSKLAIYGRSNGGLLIGAVLNQRPDLFGAAIAGVGVMDMLRFNKFTVGEAWTSDYGSPENPTEFKALRAYSPVHNVRQGTQYPAVLVLTADHDDRVVPGHSFKYTAEMQHAQAGSAPILIRIETSAGHGGGKPITKQVDEAAAIIGFLEKTLGMS